MSPKMIRQATTKTGRAKTNELALPFSHYLWILQTDTLLEKPDPSMGTNSPTG
jgi:hypothetical protein